MIKALKILFILSIILLTLISCSKDRGIVTPVVKKGVLDLRNWDFKKDGNIKLDGNWEFYWKELLTYDQLNQRKEPKQFMPVPGRWTDDEYSKKNIGPYGHATYRIKILLKKGEKNLAIQIYSAETSMTTLIDNKFTHTQGRVGTNKTSSIPGSQNKIIKYKTDKNEIHIVLNISNYHYAYGGIWRSFILGEEKSIIDNLYFKTSIEFILFGSIFIMALYHFLLYLLRKKNRATLFFSIFCLLISLRILLTGEGFLVSNTDLNWLLLIRLSFLTFYLGLIIFVLFIIELFPKESIKIINYIYFAIASTFCLITIFTPATFFPKTLTANHIITLIIGIYISYILIRSVINKNDGAATFLLGYLFMFITAIHDILYYQQIINTTDLISVGFFFFIFSQAASISLQFSKAFTDVKKLSGELKINITDLEMANEKISLSENKHRLLVEGTNDIIFTLDENFNFITVNNSIRTELKIDPENITSLNFLDLIFEDENEKTAAKDIVRKKLKQFIHDKDKIYFKTNFKSPINSEPKEMVVTMEYIKYEDKYEILGKITRIMDDELLKYFISESQQFSIENYLTICQNLSQRITRNIEKYLPKNEIKFIQLALREIIINAIEHGSLNISFDEKSEALMKNDYMEFIANRQQDPRYKDKKVTIKYSINEDELIYVIEDEGKGFEHQKFTQPTDDEIEGQMITHGRGIAMTMNIFDSLEYNEKGNKVTLIKNIKNQRDLLNE